MADHTWCKVSHKHCRNLLYLTTYTSVV
uniref:Uncharacterized protein n=1 Tax=Rhizophora mucronata TaxID=61149 RepID=A0A2P2QKH6_RHIMU